jgi:hypothetical protein
MCDRVPMHRSRRPATVRVSSPVCFSHSSGSRRSVRSSRSLPSAPVPFGTPETLLYRIAADSVVMVRPASRVRLPDPWRLTMGADRFRSQGMFPVESPPLSNQSDGLSQTPSWFAAATLLFVVIQTAAAHQSPFRASHATPPSRVCSSAPSSPPAHSGDASCARTTPGSPGSAGSREHTLR